LNHQSVKTSKEGMRAIQIVAGIASEAAGPSYSVRRLSQCLSLKGVSGGVYTTGEVAGLASAAVSTFPLNQWGGALTARLRLSAKLHAALSEAATECTVLHSHGLWLAPNLYPARVAVRKTLPLVSSPRGMLGAPALQFSKWKKRVMWFAAQRAALASSTCLHATSLAEAGEIRAAGLKNPIAIIPNGVDLPKLKQRMPSPNHRTILHLGRMHPKKGLESLLHAWSQVEVRATDWRLRIVGPDDNGYVDRLRRVAKHLNLSRVSFEPALFGAEKIAAYRSADIFVLPTQNENFGLVVAEALSCETPVICTKGAPWAGLVVNNCGWWVDQGVESLAATLEASMNLPSEALHEMGARGRSWVAREFSWEIIATEMLAVYMWVSGCGVRPSCVETNLR
jgi:glycosyltransferase involved in cell wall biosynthesis